ncbi:putative membrane protein [Murinocardiopsis flavida]|uniref:Putative membrane protein n=1 Tax=Murinocardiopsis flavida TaxID=645275 RepID=A0A2P8DP42_9ACTN|nr:hypothetical protein [Murinocardiopsis flavida]PSK98980.1 putative membrane protein [Murinocardiopsis flavida]
MHTLAAIVLGVFLVTAGAAHFAAPAYFRTLVPAWVPAPGAVVAATGLAEIAVAGLLMAPGLRAAGGWAAAALITGYLASHLDAARHAHADRARFIDRPAGIAARLAVNTAYIAWAVAVAITAP